MSRSESSRIRKGGARARPVERRLRADIATRDAFLSRVASVLSGCVSELVQSTHEASGLPRPIDTGLRRLQGLARELTLVASPREPVQLRLRKRELCSWLARFCRAQEVPAAAHHLGFIVERTGTIRVKVDAELLATVLEELLSNAIKYRRANPVRLHAAHRGKQVAITVTNHGAWVGPKPTFRRFKRGETRREVPGFGVGLWLTRRIVEAHGGQLKITFDRTHTHAVVTVPADEPGKGAWFSATLSERLPL